MKMIRINFVYVPLEISCKLPARVFTLLYTDSTS